jgi:hypothetical protein
MSLAITTIQICTFCGVTLEPTATECPACGKSVRRTRSVSDWHAFTPATHFALLWACSFGLYMVLWVYRCWKFLRAEADADVRPFLRTLGLVVPILGLFLTYQLLRETEELTSGSTREANVVFGVVWSSMTLSYFATGHALVTAIASACSAAAIWAVQRRINSCYRERYGLTSARMPVYGWIICGIGGLLWFLIVVGLLVGQKTRA